MERIIAISRQHGSGGRQIGRLLAQRLDIPFYDRQIVERAALESGIHKSYFTDADQRGVGSHFCPIAPGLPFELPMQDMMYLAQRDAICQLAQRGPCVMVGRGACEILKGRAPLLRVFLYAALEIRLRRARDEYHEPACGLEKRICEIDRKRMTYYSFYEERAKLWTEHFDLCIDSGALGLERTLDVILSAYH